MDISLIYKTYPEKKNKYYIREIGETKLRPRLVISKGKLKGRMTQFDDIEALYRTYFRENEKIYSMFVIEFIDNKPTARFNNSFIKLYKHQAVPEQLDIEHCMYNITSIYKTMDIPVNDIYKLMDQNQYFETALSYDTENIFEKQSIAKKKLQIIISEAYIEIIYDKSEENIQSQYLENISKYRLIIEETLFTKYREEYTEEELFIGNNNNNDEGPSEPQKLILLLKERMKLFNNDNKLTPLVIQNAFIIFNKIINIEEQTGDDVYTIGMFEKDMNKFEHYIQIDMITIMIILSRLSEFDMYNFFAIYYLKNLFIRHVNLINTKRRLNYSFFNNERSIFDILTEGNLQYFEQIDDFFQKLLLTESSLNEQKRSISLKTIESTILRSPYYGNLELSKLPITQYSSNMDIKDIMNKEHDYDNKEFEIEVYRDVHSEMIPIISELSYGDNTLIYHNLTKLLSTFSFVYTENGNEEKSMNMENCLLYIDADYKYSKVMNRYQLITFFECKNYDGYLPMPQIKKLIRDKLILEANEVFLVISKTTIISEKVDFLISQHKIHVLVKGEKNYYTQLHLLLKNILKYEIVEKNNTNFVKEIAGSKKYKRFI